MISFTILLVMAIVLVIGVLLFATVIGGLSIVIFGDAIICVAIITVIVLIVKKIQKKIQERKGSVS